MGDYDAEPRWPFPPLQPARPDPLSLAGTRPVPYTPYRNARPGAWNGLFEFLSSTCLFGERPWGVSGARVEGDRSWGAQHAAVSSI